MSDETTTAPVTDAPAAPAVPNPVPTAAAAPRTGGAWAFAIAAAVALALTLAGVSFGAGVFVGRATGRIGLARAEFAAGGLPQGALPGGRQGMPDQRGGMMPGQRGPGMPRGFRGSPDASVTAP